MLHYNKFLLSADACLQHRHLLCTTMARLPNTDPEIRVLKLCNTYTGKLGPHY